MAGACGKKNAVFVMKAVTLDLYIQKDTLPAQDLFIRIVDTGDASVLAQTDKYKSGQTLPATFNLEPHPEIQLYRQDDISLQLWGDSSGYLAARTIDLEEYTILFPIDIEAGSDSVRFSVKGSWKK